MITVHIYKFISQGSETILINKGYNDDIV